MLYDNLKAESKMPQLFMISKQTKSMLIVLLPDPKYFYKFPFPKFTFVLGIFCLQTNTLLSALVKHAENNKNITSVLHWVRTEQLGKYC